MSNVENLTNILKAIQEGNIPFASFAIETLIKDALWKEHVDQHHFLAQHSSYPYAKVTTTIEPAPMAIKPIINDQKPAIDVTPKTDPIGPTKWSAQAIAEAIKKDEPFTPRRRGRPPTKVKNEAVTNAPKGESMAISADKVRSVILARAKHAGVDANNIAQQMGFKSIAFVPGWPVAKKGKTVVTQYAQQMVKVLGNQILADQGQSGQVDKPALGEP